MNEFQRLWSLIRQLQGALGGNRIICGIVSGAGAVVEGSGWSVVRNATGDYTVTFDTAFAAPPVVQLTLGSTGVNPRAIKIKDGVPVTASAFSVWAYNLTPALQDSEFHFVAIG